MDDDFDKRAKTEKLKHQEAEVAKRQKQQEQRIRIDGLLRLYQSASAIEKSKDSLLGTATKIRVIDFLSDMINIVEKDDWDKIHPHEAFPEIDIRMLVNECPYDFDCPFLQAILKKINMKHMDYNSYKQRAGQMIIMEHKRKMGKKR